MLFYFEKFDAKNWDPENVDFWNKKGKYTSYRNLIISIYCLFLSFCVWVIFSEVALDLNTIGYHFSDKQIFFLISLPLLVGAIARIPYSLILPIFGGRRWTVLSTLFLILPCVWLGDALQHTNTSYYVFVCIAFLSGLAGGNFASSISYTTFFFPKNEQGKALGLNAGISNLGVCVAHFIIPIVISFALFGNYTVGMPTIHNDWMWLENAAYIWVPFLLLAAAIAWFGMNDLPIPSVSASQYIKLLKHPQLWGFSFIYLAMFGSWIGFSVSFAMVSHLEFPNKSITYYAFLGPLLGAIARPIGGWMADSFGGALVTTLLFTVMLILSFVLSMLLSINTYHLSYSMYLGLFFGLFITSGAGSGSTFQMISIIFRKITLEKILQNGENTKVANQKSTVNTALALSFVSAFGALGGFIIPELFSVSFSADKSMLTACTLFNLFYVICVYMTWLIYGDQLLKKTHN